jgi:hypothetical protein
MSDNGKKKWCRHGPEWPGSKTISETIIESGHSGPINGPEWIDKKLIELRKKTMAKVFEKINNLILSDDFKMPYYLTKEEEDAYVEELVRKMSK